jgi:RNA polymerase sigma factor CnrH
VGQISVAQKPPEQIGVTDESHALALKASSGDRGAYGALMRLWQNSLWRIARRYSGDGGESEDIVQDVFVAFWRTLNKAGQNTSAVPHDVGAYLRRATLNACRDWSRRRAVRAFFFKAEAIDDSRIQEADTANSDDHHLALEKLEHLITHLPDNLKGALILCAIEGLSQREAARVLGLSVKAVEARIARAKEALRKGWPDIDLM